MTIGQCPDYLRQRVSYVGLADRETFQCSFEIRDLHLAEGGAWKVRVQDYLGALSSGDWHEKQWFLDVQPRDGVDASDLGISSRNMGKKTVK